MTKIEVQYKDLDKALMRLEEAIVLTPTTINQDATIQRFEFTFELAWKLMKSVIDLEGLDAQSPRRAIRQAADLDLIDNPVLWFEFLDARNLTVHTYKEEIARKVYKKAKQFPPLVKELLAKTKEYTKED